MNYACQKRKNIIFVTDDVKCDWWEIDNGRWAFHDALITEFHRESKVRPSSELGKTLTRKGKSLEQMEIVPFVSTDFYKAVSSSYQIPIEDAPSLPGAYMECGVCGCQINEDNDAGTGRCITCEREADD